MEPTIFKLTDQDKKSLTDILSDATVGELLKSIKGASDSGSFSGMIVSTQGVDRDGDIVMQDGLDTAAYMTNPIILNTHQYRGIENIIGITTRIYRGNVNGTPVTLADGKFAPNEGGQLARMLYEQKFLNAASIGFMPLEFSPQDLHVITRSEMLEWSFVPVPANSGAVAQRMKDAGIDVATLVQKGFAYDEHEESGDKGAIAYHDYGAADIGASWNGPEQVAKADTSALKKICAWYDSAKPDEKGSYKLPHHNADDLKAVWRGVSAAMGVLLGARGGVDIPAADRKAVYEHLAKHYAEFNKTAPDFKLVEAQVLKDVDFAFDSEIVVEIVNLDKGTDVSDLRNDIDEIKKQLNADNGENESEGKGLTVGELMKHPDFHRGVLTVLDKALGTTLGRMKTRK